MATSLARVEEEMVITFEALGCYNHDYDYEDDEAPARCIVCGTAVDIGRFCQKDCYDLWNAPEDDDGPAFRW